MSKWCLTVLILCLVHSTLVEGSRSDPCSTLCAFDGRQICTGGSWTKGAGICHAYHYRGAPAAGDYCYHTSATAGTCPSSGAPVRAEDVARLIALRQGGPATTTTVTPAVVTTTTTTVGPPVVTTTTTTVRPAVVTTTTTTTPRRILQGVLYFDGNEQEYLDFIANLDPATTSTTTRTSTSTTTTTRTTTTTTPRPVTTTSTTRISFAAVGIKMTDLTPIQGAYRPRDILANSILSARTNAMNQRELESVAANVRLVIRDGRGSWPAYLGASSLLENWRAIRGHVLLDSISDAEDSMAERWIRVGLLLSFEFAEMFAPTRHQRQQFAAESGIAEFCIQNQERIVGSILNEFGGSWHDRIQIPTHGAMAAVLEQSYSSNIALYCPDLVAAAPSDLRLVVLLHRLYRRSVVASDYGFNRIQMTVPRARAFSSSPLSYSETRALRLPWESVTFTGEHAQGNGVIRDWFNEATREIVHRDTRLIQVSASSGVYQFPTDRSAAASGNTYRTFGRFLAVSLVQGQAIGIRLTASIYAQILGVALRPSDLAAEDPAVASSAQAMLDAPEEQLDMYPIQIDDEVLELTVANRQELIAQYLMSRVPRAARGNLASIAEGFHEVIQREWMEGVTVQDLSNFLYGRPDYDMNELIAVMRLAGGHRLQDAHIQSFFRVLRSLNREQKTRFLQFAIGSPIVPVGGFASMDPPLTIDAEADVRRYPRSKTCYHQIFLPRYPTEAILREKLLEALANNGEMRDD